MWMHVDTYAEATGGKANVSKFEGMRLGKLRARAYDHEFGSKVEASAYVLKGGRVRLSLRTPKGVGVRWCKRGDFIISLGVPHGWDARMEDWYWAKYRKAKAQMSGWHDVERMSPHGSAMLANSMVYGRYRYWMSTSVMPKAVAEAINEDVQMLVWGKDVLFDPD